MDESTAAYYLLWGILLLHRVALRLKPNRTSVSNMMLQWLQMRVMFPVWAKFIYLEVDWGERAPTRQPVKKNTQKKGGATDPKTGGGRWVGHGKKKRRIVVFYVYSNSPFVFLIFFVGLQFTVIASHSCVIATLSFTVLTCNVLCAPGFLQWPTMAAQGPGFLLCPE